MTVSVQHLDAAGLAWAQATVEQHHYRHARVDTRSSPEAWGVVVPSLGRVGCLIVNRPEATRSYPWYGSLNDVALGRASLTYWQVLNLSRVWLDPALQAGGAHHGPAWLPGYTDRHGHWRSTLASDALRALAARVDIEYLLARPPVFLEEPYEVRDLLSYCGPQHRGVIYRAAGFELYRTNADGLQTWRLGLPTLTAAEHAAIACASALSPRARRFRSDRQQQRAQLPLVGADHHVLTGVRP